MNGRQTLAPIRRALERKLSFSTRLGKLDDIPFVFRKTVTRLLEGRELKVRHILYTPEFGSFGDYCPATLFIVTDDEWLAMSADRSGAPSVRYADFSQTRLVEFSLELLDGRLVLESGEAGEEACVLRFNLASRDLFQDALAAMLGSEGAGAPQASDAPAALPGFAGLSMGMQSSLGEALMPGDRCVALAAWSRPELESGAGGLAASRVVMRPGGLLLSARYLCVFAVDDRIDRGVSGDLSVFGRGVVYLRRDLPITAGWLSHDNLPSAVAAELVLTVGEGAQVSTVSVLLPATSRPEVERVLALLNMAS